MTKVAVPVVLRDYTDSFGYWVAESRSTPGATYSITHNRFGWHCDCPARKRCAHIDALIDRLAADTPAPSTTTFDEGDWIDPSQDWAAPAYPENRTTRKPENKESEIMSNATSSWGPLSKEAERGSGYEAPKLEDDVYAAKIIEVGEPFDQAKFDAAKFEARSQFGSARALGWDSITQPNRTTTLCSYAQTKVTSS